MASVPAEISTTARVSFAVLAANIEAMLPSLTPAAARIAQLILENPERVSRLTISELGDLAGTSESTIVRSARSLGFAGYPELRLALAAAAAQPAASNQTLTGNVSRDDPMATVIAKVAAAEDDALRVTASRLDPEDIQAVVDRITHARRIDIYGIGASGLVAMDLEHKLLRIGLISRAYVESHLAVTTAVNLTKDDVVVAISYSGETAEVLELVELAQERRATVVAITSRPGSPLAKLADHLLVAGGREDVFRPGAMASRISQLFVVDCVFIGVAQQTYDATMRAVRATHSALAPRRDRKNRR